MANGFDISEVLEIVAEDEETMQSLYDSIDDIKFAQREAIEEVIDRWLTGSITDENGYLIQNALSDEEIDKLEAELKSFYSQDFMNEIFDRMVRRVQQRLQTIDDIYRELELEEAILGEDVYEMEAVNEEIDRLATSFVDAKEGDEEHAGAVAEIEEAMQRYRYDKGKSEFTLRNELRDTLRKKTSIGANYTNSMAVTSMANIDRKLRRTQALAAGIENGLYLGPYDAIIRPFCDDWIGQVETWEFWDSLHNNMPEGLFDSPVSVHCGGINCRHRIIGWQLEWSDGNRDLRAQIIGGESVAPPPTAAFDIDPRIEGEQGIDINDKFKQEMTTFFTAEDSPKVSIQKSVNSHYKPIEEKIYLNRELMNDRTVYHEYGHAMHFKTGTIHNQLGAHDETMKNHFDDFYETARERLHDVKLTPLNDSLKEERNFLGDTAREAHREGNQSRVDELQRRYDNLSEVADILAALTKGKYGWGHKRSYWQRINNADKMEFMAHMFENRYSGMNPYIDEYFPEIREIVENDFDELMQTLIEEAQNQ